MNHVAIKAMVEIVNAFQPVRSSQITVEGNTTIVDNGCNTLLLKDTKYFKVGSLQEIEPVAINVALKGNGSIDKPIKLSGYAIAKGIIPTIHYGDMEGLYVPELRRNLIPLYDVVQEPAKAEFMDDEGKLINRHTGQVLLNTKVINKLYHVNEEEFFSQDGVIEGNTTGVDMNIWHSRLGHIAKSKIVIMKQSDLVNGLEISDLKHKLSSKCEACIMGGMKKKPQQAKMLLPHELQINELTSADLSGPMPVQSLNGDLYTIQFVEHKTNLVSGYLLRKKSFALDRLKEYAAMSKVLFGTPMKTFLSDGEGGLDSKEAIEFYNSQGIKHVITTPDTPQQNGKAEVEGGLLHSMANKLLHHANLARRFWAMAYRVAVLTRNLVPRKNGKVPLEQATKKKIDISFLRIFGCLAYVYTAGRKYGNKAEKGIFVGYDANGYLIYVPRLRKVVRSKDVEFDESRMGSQFAVDERKESEELEDLVVRTAMTNNDTLSAALIPATVQSKSTQAEEVVTQHGEDNSTQAEYMDHIPVDTEMEVQPTVPENGRPKRLTRPPTHFWVNSNNGNQLEAFVADIAIEAGNWKLNPKYRKPAVNKLRNTACRKLGLKKKDLQPRVDAFASKQNKQYDKYWTIAENAFKQNWREIILYINPYFEDLPKVVGKMRAEAATGYVVAPCKPEAPWYNELLRHSVCEPEVVGNHKKDIFFPQSKDYAEAIASPPWDIVIFLVSYNDKFVLPQLEANLCADLNDENDDMIYTEDNPSLNEAMQSSEWPKWKDAIDLALEKLTKVYDAVGDVQDLPAGKKMVGYRWVLKRKRDADNNITEYKARLTVKGFTQQFGVDYNETFSPVVDSNTLRLFLAAAIYHQLDLFQADGSSAFSQGELEEEEIYIPAIGIYNGKITKTGKVQKLKKALEGTKQGARQWYRTLKKALLSTELEMTMMNADNCVFYKEDKQGKIILIVAIHVDDLPIAAIDEITKNTFLRQLNEHVIVKDQGTLKFILGTEVLYNKEKRILYMSQKAYIDKILAKHNMQECSPVRIPHFNSIQARSSDKTTDKPIRALVGELLWLARGTIPQISLHVSLLGQEQSSSLESTWNKGMELLRYIKSVRNHGLVFRLGNLDHPFRLVDYVDASFASMSDAKSMTGYAIFYSECLIAWKSSKQKTVAKSSSEAEYMALSLSASELLFLKQLAQELQLPQNSLPLIMEDNKGAIFLAKKRDNSGRARHIDVAYHFVREKLENQDLDIQHVSTDNQVADILTKPLTDLHRFDKFTRHLGVMSKDEFDTLAQ
jgi:hypothetical protein